MSNTLAHGATIQSKWANLGGTVGAIRNDPHAIKALFLGFPDSGKSALLQGCEDMFILSFDRFSTTNPEPKAVIWPRWDPSTGNIIGDDGSVQPLTYDMVKTKIGQLLTLAKNNQPRPRIVGIDTITSLLRLLRSWLTTGSNAVTAGISTTPIDEWNKMHGPSAYDWIYNEVVSIVTRLNDAGYGVYAVTHFANEAVQIGDDRTKIQPTLVVTPGFWKRLYDIFELIAVVHRARGTRPVQEVRKVLSGKNADGTDKFIEVPHTRQVPFDKVVLVTSALDFADGILKNKIQLPDIELPVKGGWDKFIEAYRQAGPTP